MIIWLGIISFSGMSQEIKEQKINTKVNEVTVFLDGAQIKRIKKITVPKGTTLLNFVKLSPFINPKSLQVKADGNVMILSVDHQQNYLKKSKKPPELIALEKRYYNLQDKIEEIKTKINIIDEQIDLLDQNKKIVGQNKGLTLNDLKPIVDYYATQLTTLKLNRLKQKRELKKLEQQQDTILKQAQKTTKIKVYPTGEVNVKVSAKQQTTATFTIIYNVKNAGWYPSYNLRSMDNDDKLVLEYKANVNQNTQVDWHNVKLSFSSSNPTVSGDIPRLIPYRLSYYSEPPTYNPNSKSVTGMVTDLETGEPLPGVNVILKGTTIGTATDFDGKYSINVPDFKGELVFSYIGYEEQSIRINGTNVVNVKLKESPDLLEAVTINAVGLVDKGMDDEGSGISLNSLTGKLNENKRNKPVIKKRELKSIAIPVDRIEKQTSVNFSIKKPYTIFSANKINTVELTRYVIPVKYEYVTVPKINENVYLLVYIEDWEKYNLLSGEANVFIDGTAVGKTLLDTGFANDTLQIAMGIDNGIAVRRELGKEYTGKKLIGTKKTDTREWIISVKNNKNRPVEVKLIDQVPVSAQNDIIVEIDKLSGGKLQEDTGKVTWKFRLPPGKMKKFILRYKVKYPRNRDLKIE